MELFIKLQTRWKISAGASEREDLRGLCISFSNSPNVTLTVSSSRPLVLGRSHCALAAVTLTELLPWSIVYMGYDFIQCAVCMLYCAHTFN